MHELQANVEGFHSISNPEDIARAIFEDIEALPVQNAAGIRGVHKAWSRRLAESPPEYLLAVARQLHVNSTGWMAAALIRSHEPALARLRESDLEWFGRGIDSWHTVDVFAGLLAGPAWMRGQIDDDVVHRWARSDDRWWRRSALVCTVALNKPSAGGYGDTGRTLAVCRLLVSDRDDMVVKGMSWALRELIRHDPKAVRDFLDEHDDVLAARVKREVRNKLEIGTKAGKRSKRKGQR
jgi:3-methyladenine DNA glycosylase AlkD